MKITKSILAKDQSFLWKQAIRQAEKRGYNARTVCLSPILEKNFLFKNHHSYLFDHLIIGANPVLTYQILLKLHAATRHIAGQDTVRIGVLFTEQEDYWGYHMLEKAELWDNLANLSGHKWGRNFSEFLAKSEDLFQDSTQHSLTFVQSDHMSMHSCRYDSYMDGYIIHLTDKKENVDNSYLEHMPYVVGSEHQICTKYKEQLLNAFDNSSQLLVFPEEKVSCEDNPIKTHLLLAKTIYLTSQPLGWLETKIFNDKEKKQYGGEEIEVTQFSHILSSTSFGSAEQIANDFYSLETQAQYDMLKIDRIKADKFDTKLHLRK